MARRRPHYRRPHSRRSKYGTWHHVGGSHVSGYDYTPGPSGEGGGGGRNNGNSGEGCGVVFFKVLASLFIIILAGASGLFIAIFTRMLLKDEGDLLILISSITFIGVAVWGVGGLWGVDWNQFFGRDSRE